MVRCRTTAPLPFRSATRRSQEQSIIRHQVSGLKRSGIVSQFAPPPSKVLIVLVVEDEALVRHLMAICLTDAGWHVLEAETAEEAIALSKSGAAVDVVITDINLNGPATGWDVAESFRTVWPHLPVVYASGAAVEPDRCVPGSLFFTKPYRPDDIVQACRQLTARAG